MRRFTTGCCMVIAWLLFQNAETAVVSGQDAGLGAGGGDLSSQIFDAVDQAGGVGGGAAGGGDTSGLNGGTAGTGGSSGTGGAGGLLDDLQPFEPPEPPPLPDPNEQSAPFVGLTILGTPTEGREFRFVGPTRESLGFGSAGGSTGGGGRLGGAAGFGGGGRGGGAGGLGNGFQVLRTQAIRSRVVPRFSAPAVAPQAVSSRFNRRITTLPTTQQFSNLVNVDMRGRVAVITGTAQNQQQLDRIQRQLRLEPGVSRIVNQVRVLQ